MTFADPPIMVLDASVLMNFLCINRMDLIARHSHEFVVTDHVADEITRPGQQNQLAEALKKRILRQASVTDPAEVALFSTLLKDARLSEGDCSVIAFASHKGHILAIDDRRASNEARRVSTTLQILTTQDLMVSMILENLLNVEEADAIKKEWAAHHQFHLKIRTFAELVP